MRHLPGLLRVGGGGRCGVRYVTRMAPLRPLAAGLGVLLHPSRKGASMLQREAGLPVKGPSDSGFDSLDREAVLCT